MLFSLGLRIDLMQRYNKTLMNGNKFIKNHCGPLKNVDGQKYGRLFNVSSTKKSADIQLREYCKTHA